MKVYIAQTIDGYIAGPGGSLDHLEPFSGTDFGYDAFIAGVDARVMGRGTFDAVWPTHGWPYTDLLPGVVLTTRTLPEGVPERVVARTDIERIAADYPQAYVDGGQVIAQFLEAGYVAEAYIFTLPVLLSGGIKLFENPISRQQNWVLKQAKSYPCGTVLNHYLISDK